MSGFHLSPTRTRQPPGHPASPMWVFLSPLCISDKILVHCVMGRSRSATLVLAYLMIHRNMTLVDAIQQVAKNRCVLPNRGFLKQLRELDRQLVQQRRQAQHGEDAEKCEQEP